MNGFIKIFKITAGEPPAVQVTPSLHPITTIKFLEGVRRSSYTPAVFAT